MLTCVSMLADALAARRAGSPTGAGMGNCAHMGPHRQHSTKSVGLCSAVSRSRSTSLSRSTSPPSIRHGPDASMHLAGKRIGLALIVQYESAADDVGGHRGDGTTARVGVRPQPVDCLIGVDPELYGDHSAG